MKGTNILFDLIDIWAKQGQFYSITGKIESVDTSNRTCSVTPNDGAPLLEDVSLEADYEESESKGFYIVPTVGSNVIVTFKSKDYGFLSAYTSIDQVVAKQGEWIFNDGANVGLVKIIELTEKLNNLVSEVNALKDKYNNHVNVIPAGTVITSVSGGSGSPAVGVPNATPIDLSIGTSDSGSNATDFDKSDYENELIKH